MRMRMGFGPDGQAAVNPESDGADLDSSESRLQSPLICVNSVPRAIVGPSVPALGICTVSPVGDAVCVPCVTAFAYTDLDLTRCKSYDTVRS